MIRPRLRLNLDRQVRAARRQPCITGIRITRFPPVPGGHRRVRARLTEREVRKCCPGISRPCGSNPEPCAPPDQLVAAERESDGLASLALDIACLRQRLDPMVGRDSKHRLNQVVAIGNPCFGQRTGFEPIPGHHMLP